jgi:hypothetical protein
MQISVLVHVITMVLLNVLFTKQGGPFFSECPCRTHKVYFPVAQISSQQVLCLLILYLGNVNLKYTKKKCSVAHEVALSAHV